MNILYCTHTDEVRSVKSQECYHELEPTVTEQYAAYLKSYYIAKFAHPGSDGKWPNIEIDRYVELTITKDCSFSHENAVQFSLSSIKKGIDDLVSRKETIGISGIACLQANSVPHKAVLIVGAPGIGKTSLVRRLCLEWAQGKLLQHYEIVILLQLRDRCLITAKSIGEIIDPDDPDNGMAIFKEMKRNRGDKVLIIFDGYDEATAEMKECKIIQRLFEGITLPLATVLITTRPAATTKLVKDSRFDQKLEVLGFTKRNILQYARQYFLKEKKPGETCWFRRYLKFRPHIFAMMYNPLHCAIVTETYSFNLANGRPIHTMTDLYTNLTLSLLSRYSSVRYTSYDELPDSVADKFWDLVELAFVSLRDYEFVVFHVPDDLIELGFLQSFPRMYSHKDASSCHSFLHLTIQEYLAALHASTNLFLMRTYFSVLSFPNAVYFLAGLTHMVRPFQMHSRDLIRHDDAILSLFEIQSAKEINDIIQSFLSANQPIACEIHYPMMSYAVGYLIALTNQAWTVAILNMTSGVANCFCRGYEAGGGQCDPGQIEILKVRLTCPSDYFCMLELPQSFLENVHVLSYVHDSCSYAADSNLLCLVWARMPNLIGVEYNLSPPFHNSTFFYRRDGLLLSVNDIWSLFFTSWFFRDTGIAVYTRSHFPFHYISATVVQYFWLRSYMNCQELKILSYITPAPWCVGFDNGDVQFLMCCTNNMFSIELFAEWFWFASKSPTDLEEIAHNYYYNPHLHLDAVSLTTHLTAITITGLNCPQSTVALLNYVLHSNLLPSTATSFNLTHTTSTIIHHLLTALSRNHQLFCWRITDCSLLLRTLSHPVPLSFLRWKSSRISHFTVF